MKLKIKALAKPKKTPMVVPGSLRLFQETIDFITDHKMAFLRFTAVYFGLLAVLAGLLSTSYDASVSKTDLTSLGDLSGGSLSINTQVFWETLGVIGSTPDSSTTLYRAFVFVISFMAVLWLIRKLGKNKDASVKEAFYKGMYPLVPLMLVILWLSLELIPLAIANWLLFIVIGAGIPANNLELGMVWLAWLIISFPSFYALPKSVIALFIVTLPDETPISAIKTAKNLVKKRRGMVF